MKINVSSFWEIGCKHICTTDVQSFSCGNLKRGKLIWDLMSTSACCYAHGETNTCSISWAQGSNTGQFCMTRMFYDTTQINTHTCCNKVSVLVWLVFAAWETKDVLPPFVATYRQNRFPRETCHGNCWHDHRAFQWTMISVVSKWWPFSFIFNQRNWEESQRIMSVGMTVMLFWAKIP
jgi:hypothetical protein